MKTGLKFGIVGCGRIGQRHAEHIHAIGELVAVCDTVKEKAKQLAEKYKVGCYEDMDEMLRADAKPDVISVCTPNGLHAEQSIKALKAGFHVLCEKEKSYELLSTRS